MHIHGRCAIILPVLVLLSISPAPAPSADEAYLHNMAGLALLYSGKDREAFNEFVHSLKINPNQPQPHFQLGRIFERQRKYDLALKQYQEALTLEPSFPGAAEAVRRLGFYVAPRPRQELDVRSITARADHTRKVAGVHDLLKAGRFDDARLVIEQLIAENPNDGSLHVLAGDAYQGLKNPLAAVRCYKAAKAMLPHSPQLCTSLAFCLYQVGSFWEADTEAREALASDPQNPRIFDLLAKIATARGDKSDAFRYTSAASRLNPQDLKLKATSDAMAKDVGLTHYANGVYYYQTQNWKKAKEELVAALKQGNLPPEESSDAQVKLVVVDFTLANIRRQIAAIQKEQQAREFGYLDKRLAFDEVIRQPTMWKEGRTVDFRGWIVSIDNRREGAEVVVSTDLRDRFTTNEGDERGRRRDSVEILPGFTGPSRLGNTNLVRTGAAGFRSNTEMARWFTLKTPKELPKDDRIRANSQIRVLGTLSQPAYIRNAYNNTFSRYPQPVIQATALEFRRESEVQEPVVRAEGIIGRGSMSGQGALDTGRFPSQVDIGTPPGVAGTLKIDYLRPETGPAAGP
ncbi:MAG: tetratricopeptide repeat protein [Candidatus Riflebacteria bacterium]|nr:tetratricopeptide repeat protein [Candidatus Riflebacteria bacterium]